MVEIVPELAVADVERSVDFYVEVLGLELLDLLKIEEEPVWAELSLGGGKLMLQRLAEVLEEFPILMDRPLGGTGLVVLRLADEAGLRAIEAQVQESGVDMLREATATDYGTVDLAMADPDGYIVICSAPSAVSDTDSHGSE